jgi:hypothetical protein
MIHPKVGMLYFRLAAVGKTEVPRNVAFRGWGNMDRHDEI